jgi:hypothetical protein
LVKASLSSSKAPGEDQDEERDEVTQSEWQWTVTPGDQQRAERIPLIRGITYEMQPDLFETEFVPRAGKALTLNIASGGMLVLMDQLPKVTEVLKVYVPTPISQAQTPTLAEVAWTRPLPFAPDSLHFVGLKFVI